MYKQNQNEKIIMLINNLIDFHCHLDLYPNFQSIINSCEKDEIYTLTVTTTPRAWPKNRDLTRNTRYVRSALGIHPQLIKGDASEELLLWEKYLPETRYIGEVGIDAGPRFVTTLNEQKRVFEHILKCCEKTGNKVLTIHSAHAVSIVLDSIETFLKEGQNKVVMHWFTGNEVETKRAVELGCYFSVNAAMTRTKRGNTLLTRLPIERILTESDGPFVELNNKPIEPRNVINVVNSLAKLRETTPDKITNTIFLNLKTLLKK
jgi:TatD DNase family protein